MYQTSLARFGTCLILLAACGTSERPLSQRAALASCTLPIADTAGWQLVWMKGAPASLRLPPGAEELRRSEAEPTGQTWKGEGDLSVGYSVQTAAKAERGDTATGVVSRVECVATIGGLPAHVVSYYQSGAVVPGQVLLAWWRFAGDRELGLVAIARDSLRKRELWGILSTVQFEGRP